MTAMLASVILAAAAVGDAGIAAAGVAPRPRPFRNKRRFFPQNEAGGRPLGLLNSQFQAGLTTLRAMPDMFERLTRGLSRFKPHASRIFLLNAPG